MQYCGRGDLNDKLYRFVSDFSCLGDVLRGEVRFTRPAELNDPSELAPILDREEVSSSLRELRRRGHTPDELEGLRKQASMMERLAPGVQAIPTPQTCEEADERLGQSLYENMDFVEQAFETMIQSILENSAVACFTRRWNSLPMWAHYAARGRGFLVEYQELDRVFVGDETGWLNQPQEVVYESRLSGISFHPDSYARIFFTKFRDWAYEMEIRVVSELSRCETKVMPGSRFYFQRVPIEAIKGIVLGWRCGGEEIDHAYRAFEEAGASTSLLKQVRFRRGKLETALVA